MLTLNSNTELDLNFSNVPKISEMDNKPKMIAEPTGECISCQIELMIPMFTFPFLFYDCVDFVNVGTVYKLTISEVAR